MLVLVLVLVLVLGLRSGSGSGSGSGRVVAGEADVKAVTLEISQHPAVLG